MAVVTSATITAKTGPAVQNTSIVFSSGGGFLFDVGRGVLTVFQNAVGSPNRKEYDLVGVTTVTCTVSGGNYTLTVS